jgi:hypothetical protein
MARGGSAAGRADAEHQGRRFRGSFVVMGATGVGKTSLIRGVTAASAEEMEAGGAALGVDSVTMEFRTTRAVLKRPQSGISLQPFPSGVAEMELTFMDTIGFGAADVDTADIATRIAQNVVEHMATQLNGFILVNRGERYREEYVGHVAVMQRLAAAFGATDAHVLVVVTHTMQYNEARKKEYADELFEKLRGVVLRDNIIHANFANWAELDSDSRGQFERAFPAERGRVLEKLLTLGGDRGPVNPFQEYVAPKLAQQRARQGELEEEAQKAQRLDALLRQREAEAAARRSAAEEEAATERRDRLPKKEPVSHLALWPFAVGAMVVAVSAAVVSVLRENANTL